MGMGRAGNKPIRRSTSNSERLIANRCLRVLLKTYKMGLRITNAPLATGRFVNLNTVDAAFDTFIV